ncbi:protein enabled isoform X2 [Planococcus citri]|uniref:protein enabled isoform X2 n=1 Tax=Planococcus citri TaxID=170843 RepID=UPI0031F74A7D
MNETSIALARASVMIYDDVNKRWVPSGSSSGVSKVHIFQHNFNNTFRVVGRKLQDHEVVINCVILRNLKYNQATATFHQWRDKKQVYGLNFSSKDDADAFAKAMNYAVETLNNTKQVIPPPIPVSTNNSSPNVAVNGQFQQQQMMPQTNGQYDEDMGYRTMTKEDMVVLQERRMSQQSQILSSPGSVSTISSVSVSPQGPPGHHRTSSAPPAPQPPPLLLSTPPVQPVACVAPPPPSAPMAPAAPAPPCPPPLPSNLNRSNDSGDMGSLAAQLQSARLRRSNNKSAENSGSSTSSSGSNYGTLGRVGGGSVSGGGGGMASMMDEMQKTLARRRAAVERKEPESVQEENNTSQDKKLWNNKNANGCESPKPARKQFVSSEELTTKVNGEMSTLPVDLENLKQEIFREIRKEFSRMKQDIIDAIKVELSRR